MHELSLTLSILNIVQEYAEKHGFDTVNSLKLSFGRLSSVEPKALEFAFEIQSKGTKAEGASLEFLIKPIIIHCNTCDADYEVETYLGTCCQCQGPDVILMGGTEELQLLEMDVNETKGSAKGNC
jgi:hydrogenase nickel incorporation protein HypA/HybF